MKNKTLPYLTGLFFDGISSGMFMMALPWIMLQGEHMGTFVALVALTCTLVSFVTTPYFSTLVDQHDRKQILICNQILQASVAFIVLLAYWQGWQSNWLLAAAQLVFWVSSNLAWSANNAFTQENYSKAEYATIAGQQEVVMQATTLGAGALGIVLLEHWSMTEFALFAGVASSLATLAYCLTPYYRQLTVSAMRSWRANLSEVKTTLGAARRFYALVFLSCLTYPLLTYLSKLVPIWFAEQGVNGNWFAAYNLCFGLGSMLTGFAVRRLLATWSASWLIQISLYGVTALLILMSFASPLYLVLLTAGFGFFNALNRISRTNWMHHQVAIDLRGRIDGVMGMFSTLTQSLGYVLIALLTHAHLTLWGFYVAAALMLLVAMLVQHLNRVPLIAPNLAPCELAASNKR